MSKLDRMAIVIITRNRCEEVLQVLGRLLKCRPRLEILVVDNGSSDRTLEALQRFGPAVRIVPAGRNLGAAGRNLGVADATRPYVAFCDDDSCWDPISLSRAVEIFEGYPHVGLLAGKILVGSELTIDPLCRELALSPLEVDRPLPGPAILGFAACGAIVRKQAFLDAGGFHPHMGVGGEEELLAWDMAAKGWALSYVEEIFAEHFPSPSRDKERRQAILIRNRLWTTWLRRPSRVIFKETSRTLKGSVLARPYRKGLTDALKGLPWVMRQRTTLPGRVEKQLEALASHDAAVK